MYDNKYILFLRRNSINNKIIQNNKEKFKLKKMITQDESNEEAVPFLIYDQNTKGISNH